MTPESVLEEASDALKHAKSIGLYHGHLCYCKGKLQAFQHNHTTDRHPIFFLFNHDHIINGLSTKEREYLKTKLWNFFKEKY